MKTLMIESEDFDLYATPMGAWVNWVPLKGTLLSANYSIKSWGVGLAISPWHVGVNFLCFSVSFHWDN
jgi:hypothetical protein